MQVNVFEIVSRPCTDDRITLRHPAVCTQHKPSSGETHLEWNKNKLDDLPENLSIVALVFLHGRCFSMLFEVILQIDGKKNNRDARKIRRL